MQLFQYTGLCWASFFSPGAQQLGIMWTEHFKGAIIEPFPPAVTSRTVSIGVASDQCFVFHAWVSSSDSLCWLIMCLTPDWFLTDAPLSHCVLFVLCTNTWRRQNNACKPWQCFFLGPAECCADDVSFWTVFPSFPPSLHIAQEPGWALCNAVSVAGRRVQRALGFCLWPKKKTIIACRMFPFVMWECSSNATQATRRRALIMRVKWFEAALPPLTDPMLPLLHQSILQSTSMPTAMCVCW